MTRQAVRVGEVLVAIAAIAAMPAGCALGGGSSTERGSGSEAAAATLPFGEKFSTTAFERSGREVAILDGERLVVTFTEEDGEMSIGWESGCNDFGSRLESASEIRVRRPVSTLVGCPAPSLEQDGVIARFFDSGPDWSLEDERLVLTSGTTTIELESQASGQVEPEASAAVPAAVVPGEELDCEFGPGQIVGATYDVNLSAAGEPKAFLALRDFLRREDLDVAAYEFDRYGSESSVSFGLVIDGAFVAEVETIEGKNGWLTSGYEYCRGAI